MKRYFYIVTLSLLVLFVLLNVFIPNNLVLQILGALDLVTISVFAIAKEKSLYKILTIAILITVVLSYIVPGTTMNYGSVSKGTQMPIPFADVFTNGITSLSAFLTTFIYVLVIGAFYAVLHKTGKYDTLVNNVAATFRNKGLCIVLVVLGLGLATMFTGEMFSMLIFVPFLISVVKRLGYSKETAIASTIGAILLGNAGSLFTYYSNQMLSLTVKDNVMPKLTIALVGLVALIAFILVFGERPSSTKDLKKENNGSVLPLHIIMIGLFILLVLGFVNWNGYFGFKGFDTFLENIRKSQIAKVSVFDALVGKSVVAFGSWQPFNAAVLFTFVTVLIGLIYKVGINGFFESFAKGLKKAFPYAMIVILANIVLVNVYSSGIFYTMVVGLTKKSVSILTGTVTSILAAFFYPDYAYSTQFTVTALTATKATDYQKLFAVLYQAVYNVFLLVSPTSILLLLGLKYTDTRFKDWMKYIWKFFLVLFVTILVVVSLGVKGFDAFGIVALVLLIVAIGIITYLRVSKAIPATPAKEEEVNKVEVKKVEEKPEKKEETKKPTTKKNNKKKSKK